MNTPLEQVKVDVAAQAKEDMDARDDQGRQNADVSTVSVVVVVADGY